MTIWFSADTHFYHQSILRHTHRKFDSVEEMNEAYVEEWNATISKGDMIYHLGDFSFGTSKEIRQVFHRLRGKKVLVAGNHDDNRTRRLAWTEVHDLKRLRVNNQTMWLCHYPMLTWANAHHGTWMLHGHSHGNIADIGTTRMDVGVDATGKLLSPYEDIYAKLSLRTYLQVDHHYVGEADE